MFYLLQVFAISGHLYVLKLRRLILQSHQLNCHQITTRTMRSMIMIPMQTILLIKILSFPKGEVHLNFCDQNKPNQTAKNFWSPIQVKFGMLQLAHNSTHHTKFEANWRLFEFLRKIFSFVKFTNNVTAYKSCLKGPSNFSFKFFYKRCVSPSINSIRLDKYQNKDILNF